MIYQLRDFRLLFCLFFFPRKHILGRVKRDLDSISLVIGVFLSHKSEKKQMRFPSHTSSKYLLLSYPSTQIYTHMGESQTWMRVKCNLSLLNPPTLDSYMKSQRPMPIFPSNLPTGNVFFFTFAKMNIYIFSLPCEKKGEGAKENGWHISG